MPNRMQFDTNTFVNLVRAMRDSQKKYFKTHDYNVMMDSKHYESLVDKMIDKWDEKELVGPGLFGET